MDVLVVVAEEPLVPLDVVLVFELLVAADPDDEEDAAPPAPESLHEPAREPRTEADTIAAPPM